tara:strand:+ start:1559 stop:2419 length:861 start_codon:yes stop_codon:yes gene_type:complete
MSGDTPTIEPTGGGVGAHVSNIDLRTELSDDSVALLFQALGDYGVLFFADQNITPDQHLAFAGRFAPVVPNVFLDQVPGYPDISLVQKRKGQRYNIGGDWHTDHSYDKEPALGSILVARETPERGGDTLFTNMYTAYDTLSDGLKEVLGQLSSVHSTSHVYGVAGNRPRLVAQDEDMRGRKPEDYAIKETIHPVVIRHPISGRKVLYVDPGYTQKIDGWTDEESEPFLKMLFAHATRPELTYRFQWKPGSIAFWDNRCTCHYAVNDYEGGGRVMHRVTVEGVPLVA